MEILNNDKIFTYLNHIKNKQDDTYNIILCDTKKVIYDNKEITDNKIISKDLLNYILTMKDEKLICNILKDKKTINIYETDTSNKSCKYQLISLLYFNNKIIGAIIISSYLYELEDYAYKENLDFLKLIKINIENIISNNKENLQYQENNILDNIYPIKDLLSETIDEGLKYIINSKYYKDTQILLHFKIDCLSNRLNYEEKELLKEIIEHYNDKQLFQILQSHILLSDMEKKLEKKDKK